MLTGSRVGTHPRVWNNSYYSPPRGKGPDRTPDLLVWHALFCLLWVLFLFPLEWFGGQTIFTLCTVQGFQMFTGVTGAKRRKMRHFSERLGLPKLCTLGRSLAQGSSHGPTCHVVSENPSKNVNLTSLYLLYGVGPGHR